MAHGAHKDQSSNLSCLPIDQPHCTICHLSVVCPTTHNHLPICCRQSFTGLSTWRHHIASYYILVMIANLSACIKVIILLVIFMLSYIKINLSNKFSRHTVTGANCIEMHHIRPRRKVGADNKQTYWNRLPSGCMEVWQVISYFVSLYNVNAEYADYAFITLVERYHQLRWIHP